MPESDIISADFWSILFENLTSILSDDDKDIAVRYYNICYDIVDMNFNLYHISAIAYLIRIITKP